MEQITTIYMDVEFKDIADQLRLIFLGGVFNP